ncbi:MAG: DUF4402 domain-containing protein [Sphingomonadales bacterium]|nr:MAG: DUF4402 domain-containing protein [Sphingomonadales bacterium]
MVYRGLLGRIGWPLAATLAAVFPSVAHAAPGDSAEVDGTATVRIVEPLAIQSLEDLRFGTFLVPLTSGTVTVGGDGSVTSNLDLSVFPGDRGPAYFLILGEPNRRFVLQLPRPIDISNGTSTMRVNQFRSNTPANRGTFSADGLFELYIGGRLNVSANQEVGYYTGTFEVRVLYQ